MSNDFKCFIGLHKDEIHKELEVKDKNNNVVGLNVVSKCANCGHIKSVFIPTDIDYVQNSSTRVNQK